MGGKKWNRIVQYNRNEVVKWSRIRILLQTSSLSFTFIPLLCHLALVSYAWRVAIQAIELRDEHAQPSPTPAFRKSSVTCLPQGNQEAGQIQPYSCAFRNSIIADDRFVRCCWNKNLKKFNFFFVRCVITVTSFETKWYCTQKSWLILKFWSHFCLKGLCHKTSRNILVWDSNCRKVVTVYRLLPVLPLASVFAAYEIPWPVFSYSQNSSF